VVGNTYSSLSYWGVNYNYSADYYGYKKKEELAI
jgi:hypothetical protein